MSQVITKQLPIITIDGLLRNKDQEKRAGTVAIWNAGGGNYSIIFPAVIYV
jgi:hypothetical protein